MSERVPPNAGRVEFPVALHVRCTREMLDEFKARGGGRWLRALIAANTRPPAQSEVAPVPHAGKIREARATRNTPRSSRATKSRRVPLDKKKRRRV